MTADPHTLHCAAKTEPARLQGPMCLGTEQHQKFIWNSKLEDFSHMKCILFVKKWYYKSMFTGQKKKVLA